MLTWSQVLSFWDVKTFVLSGDCSTPARTRTIRQFEDCNEFAVLIVSSVGVAGLNLQCAHILIIVVSL